MLCHYDRLLLTLLLLAVTLALGAAQDETSDISPTPVVGSASGTNEPPNTQAAVSDGTVSVQAVVQPSLTINSDALGASVDAVQPSSGLPSDITQAASISLSASLAVQADQASSDYAVFSSATAGGPSVLVYPHPSKSMPIEMSATVGDLESTLGGSIFPSQTQMLGMSTAVVVDSNQLQSSADSGLKSTPLVADTSLVISSAPASGSLSASAGGESLSPSTTEVGYLQSSSLPEGNATGDAQNGGGEGSSGEDDEDSGSHAGGEVAVGIVITLILIGVVVGMVIFYKRQSVTPRNFKAMMSGGVRYQTQDNTMSYQDEGMLILPDRR